MMNPGQNRPRLVVGILRDLFVVVLAEVLVLVLAWCLSPRGRSILAGLFRTKPSGGSEQGTTASTIDV